MKRRKVESNRVGKFVDYVGEGTDDFFQSMLDYYKKFVSDVRFDDPLKKRETISSCDRVLQLYLDSLTFERCIKEVLVINENRTQDESYVVNLIDNIVKCHDSYERDFIMNVNDTKWV